MKNTILISVLFWISMNAFSQDCLDTVFFNAQWEVTKSRNYEYYRVVTKGEDGIYACRDYWNTGELQMYGRYSTLFPLVEEGQFKWYDKSGFVKKITNFRNGEICGEIVEYDSAGNEAIKYIVDIDSLDNADDLIASANELRYYVTQNLRYPERAQENGIQGKVVTTFFINEKGSLSNLKILDHVDSDLDMEAIRVIRAYKYWPKPKYHGNTTSLKITFPVVFILRQ